MCVCVHVCACVCAVMHACTCVCVCVSMWACLCMYEGIRVCECGKTDIHYISPFLSPTLLSSHVLFKLGSDGRHISSLCTAADHQHNVHTAVHQLQEIHTYIRFYVLLNMCNQSCMALALVRCSIEADQGGTLYIHVCQGKGKFGKLGGGSHACSVVYVSAQSSGHEAHGPSATATINILSIYYYYLNMCSLFCFWYCC